MHEVIEHTIEAWSTKPFPNMIRGVSMGDP